MLFLLHKGYRLPGHGNCKLSHHRTGPFTIQRRIGQLAYELEFPECPTYNRIHCVVSVADWSHIQPTRTLMAQQIGPVQMKGDAETDAPSFEIEHLIGQRTIQRGRRYFVQYLVKWTGYGPSYNEWHERADLEDARELVEEYDHTYSDNDASRVQRRDRPHRA